ncbi:hypothetical protein BJ170DRAFT_590610 [Xylariales sp. AK1849]|nr:hypothetical protein BJ170DRAFT_590610 [Xylariales sp. AK1849]
MRFTFITLSDLKWSLEQGEGTQRLFSRHWLTRWLGYTLRWHTHLARSPFAPFVREDKADAPVLPGVGKANPSDPTLHHAHPSCGCSHERVGREDNAADRAMRRDRGILMHVTLDLSLPREDTLACCLIQGLPNKSQTRAKMSRYNRPTDTISLISGSSGSSRSSRSSASSSGYDSTAWSGSSSHGSVSRHTNRHDSLAIRLATHFLQGPFAGKKSHFHRHDEYGHGGKSSKKGRSSRSRSISPPSRVHREPMRPGPPPPPPMGGRFGGGAQGLGGGPGFIQLNGGGGPPPPPPGRMPVGSGPSDPVWGRQPQGTGWRAAPPRPTVELVNE